MVVLHFRELILILIHISIDRLEVNTINETQIVVFSYGLRGVLFL